MFIFSTSSTKPFSVNIYNTKLKNITLIIIWYLLPASNFIPPNIVSIYIYFFIIIVKLIYYLFRVLFSDYFKCRSML